MSNTVKNYGIITSVEQFAKLAKSIIDGGKPFGFDIETGYTGPDRAKTAVQSHHPDSLIAGFSFAGDTSWARYVPVAHDFSQENLDNRECALVLWELLQTGNGVAHNSLFELLWLSKWFVKYIPDVPGVLENNGFFPILADTMIMSYLAAEFEAHGLKYLVEVIFGHKMTVLIDLFEGLPKNRAKMLRFNVLELLPKVVDYACDDAAWCLALYEYFLPAVQDMFLFKVEHAIIPIIAEMEDFGLAFDWEAMAITSEKAQEFSEKLNAEIQTDFYLASGDENFVNLASPQQLRTALFEKLNLPVVRLTKTGASSTDAISLRMLASKSATVQKLLDWRALNKLRRSYLDKYERDYLYAEDGRAHPSLLQAIVPAGRFSCSDPNYQQLPKKYKMRIDARKKKPNDAMEAYAAGGTFDCNFRNFVITPKDHYGLGFDYAQIEFRMLAGVTQEPMLIDAFERGIDMHKVTAALLFDKAYEDVTDEERGIAKTLGFAIVYGLGVGSLAQRFKVSREEAQELQDKFFARFTKVQKWMDDVKDYGKHYGFVTTKFGRKVRIWEFLSSNKGIYNKGERLCVNAPLQGSAADYIKVAMIRTDKVLREHGLKDKVHLVMNVHDALEWYVHKSVDPAFLIKILEPAVNFPVEGLPEIKSEWHIWDKLGSTKEVVLVDGILVYANDEEQKKELEEIAEEIEDPDSDDSVPVLTRYETVVLLLGSLPTGDQVSRLATLIEELPGQKRFAIEAAGTRRDFPHLLSSIDHIHLDVVRRIFPDASIRFEESWS